MQDTRPDPDRILHQIQQQEADAAHVRGRLKIFFGYAAGVGKTYAMLEAAHAALAAGTDVVAGYIEPHTRPDTLALLEGLEQFKAKKTHTITMKMGHPYAPMILTDDKDDLAMVLPVRLKEAA